jgi:hypothetical protein
VIPSFWKFHPFWWFHHSENSIDSESFMNSESFIGSENSMILIISWFWKCHNSDNSIILFTNEPFNDVKVRKNWITLRGGMTQFTLWPIGLE